MTSFPSGTVTFVFTDIEGSTQLLRQLGDGYGALVSEHHRILREIFAEHGGSEVDTQGDAFFYSFPRARGAVAAAVAGQRSLAGHAWPHGVEVRVRMGLHTGEPAVGEEGYVGLDVVRAARICAAGHGGQVLLSETTRALVGSDLPEGVSIVDLGDQQLKDVHRERVFQLVLDGQQHSFPALKTDRDTAATDLGDRIAEQVESYVERQIASALGAGGQTPTRLIAGLTAFGLLALLGFVLVLVAIAVIVKVAFF